jgi:hypothetical protein
VVRVPSYRSRGPGSDSRRYHIFWVLVGLERGPLNFVSTTDELLGRNSSGFGLENWKYGLGDLLCWPRHPLSSKIGTNFAEKWRSLSHQLGKSGKLHTPAHFTSVERSPLWIGLKAEWAPESVWTWCRRVSSECFNWWPFNVKTLSQFYTYFNSQEQLLHYNLISFLMSAASISELNTDQLPHL